ncbi:MAG: hypothetical protein HOJ71_05140 [Euryarchaeota archaeon]|nr:hypothetical protein [Euryarchaeota archaeon]
MNGHWLVRILFLGALASISFGLGLFDASNQTLETPEGLDNFSPDDLPLEASDSAEDAKIEDDAEAFDGSDAKSDVHGEIFIGLGSGMLALLFVGTSLFEIVKIAVLMALITPLITRKTKEDELNRGRILGFIEGNAGIHFSALRDALQLANGVTAHHLQSMESSNQIVSWRDGKLRRYAAANLPADRRTSIAHPIVGTRLAILETLSDAGQVGLSNTQLTEKLRLSRQLTSYHVKYLSHASLIEPTQPKKRSPWKLTVLGLDTLAPTQDR